ncbi:MAG TPA: alpha/beta fold hydrolase [Longimicrobiales bacterium]|nr:alpha/beta fold hydrolase [Longimicrobiales bacterium]
MQRRTWTGRVLAGVSVAVRLLGLSLFGYALLIFVVQRRIVFPGAQRESPRASATAPAGATQVWLEASFGRVEAWFFPTAAAAAAPTVVFAHGNGELIEDWQSEMETLSDEGVNALLVEFPGYGHSEGKPSREAIREAFGEAFDWLVAEADVASDRIVAYGRSVGGGAAADLSQDRPVGALALQSTFSSSAAMARAAFLPGFLVLDRFDNREAVAEFDGPVLVMHGLEDEVIPYAHALSLASAREGLDVVEIDCGHNDCAPAWPDIVTTLTAFLRDNGLLEAAATDQGGGLGSD